ncbi:hypothetical protein J6590_041157 [Homalodisca vitripennis]|nr:hypothetical protein J6590_041157 [Homalodisca vitripennis]
MYSDMRLLKDLRENHKNDYRIYLQMDDETFSYVLEKVRPRIERQDTNLKAITAEQRLVATKKFCVSSRRGKYRRVFATRERKITSKDTPLSALGPGLVHTLAGGTAAGGTAR